MASRLGVPVPLPKHPGLTALVVPTSYLPQNMPCPALGTDMLCSIHDEKPTRCKSMPFYPYREERFQAEVINPRKGWECDISDAAPLVFVDHKIVHRADFDHERHDIEEQAPIIQMFANYLFKYNPLLMATLAHEASKPHPGQIVSSLSSFLTATRNPNARDIARSQIPVLSSFVQKTVGQSALQAYHVQYAAWLEEMVFLAGPLQQSSRPI